MPTFDSSGVDINYIDEGSGSPIVLVHGFASYADQNWRATGVIDALLAGGRRVIALDCRAHGKSGKPHDSAAYEGTKMPDDVPALMDHLGVEKADLMGYSMGGFIATSLMVRMPERFNSVILGGVGDMVLGGGLPEERAKGIADAMEVSDASTVTNQDAKAFRLFAQANGNDLQALAAMQRVANPRWYNPRDLANVNLPVAVIVGTEDTLVLPADRLVAAIPGARFITVPGDHIMAPGKPEFRQAALAFLDEHSPVPV